MTRGELVSKLAYYAGVSRVNCDAVLEAMPDVIAEALANGDKVPIRNLIIFETSTRAKRSARNPSTGEIVIFPEVRTVRCKVSRALKDAINDR